jgi:hypothetical protein
MTSIPDVVGVALATLAIGLSLVTVLVQRRQHQRDAYRQMYQALMADDLHRGRWLVVEIGRTGVVPDEPEERRLVYRTLGTFDNLAMYVRHRVVPRSWVLDVWHHPLREMRDGAQVVRDADPTDAVPWPQLWKLFDEADSYKSNLACCEPQR